MKIHCDTCGRDLETASDDAGTAARRIQTHCDKSFHHKHYRVQLHSDTKLPPCEIAIDYPRAGKMRIDGKNILVRFDALHDRNRNEDGDRD